MSEGKGPLMDVMDVETERSREDYIRGGSSIAQRIFGSVPGEKFVKSADVKK